MRQSNHQYSTTPDHYANSYHTQSQQNFSIKSSSIKAGGGRSSLIIPTNVSNQQYLTSQSQIHTSSGNAQSTAAVSSQNSLPPSSSISMKLKNSLIIQKEAQKNKENVFRLKERVEEAQKRVDNLEKYEKSFSGMSDLLNGMAKDFKQSYVVSRTSYSPPSGQQKCQIQSRHMQEEIELTRGNMHVIDCPQVFDYNNNNNPTSDMEGQYSNQNSNNFQNNLQSQNQVNYNTQIQQEQNSYNNQSNQGQQQLVFNQRRFGSQISQTDIHDDIRQRPQQNSQQQMNNQLQSNNQLHQINQQMQNNSSQLNIQLLSRKNTLFKDIKNRMELFKTQNRDSITNHLKYIANKINENRGSYYNFFDEENKVALKFLVQVLYDEVEKILILDGGNTLPLKLKIEDLTKEINEKNKRINQLEEELIERNLHINSMATKLTRYTQRFNDLRWILEESKRIYEDFTVYQQELLSSDMYAYDETRKLKFIQIANIQKEFNRLKDNFDELKIGNSNQKTNPHQANFFFQGNSLTPPNQSSIRPMPANSQMKQQNNQINNYHLDNSASSSSHIGIAPEIMIKKQLEFDEDCLNQNNYSNNHLGIQNTNQDSYSSVNLFNMAGNNNNSQTNITKRNRHNSVSSTSNSMMMLNKMHQPTTNRSLTPNHQQANQGNRMDGMYQSNIVTSDHNQMAHSSVFNAQPQHQRANQSMVMLHNNSNNNINANTSTSQIFGKNGNKFLDIKQQIEQLENEYNDLDNFQQSLEDQVVKYKHCFVEQLKLCQLLQKSVYSLEEDNNQLRQQNKQSTNNLHTSQFMQAASQQQAAVIQQQAAALQQQEDLEKDIQKITQQLKQTQKECETLHQENNKIQKEHTEVQQKYAQQVKELQEIEEQRKNDKQIVQKLNSQFQQMKRECEEKQRLEDKIKTLSNDNNHLNKELDECLGLLESGKINIEQLKNTLQTKDENSSEIAKKNANLEVNYL